MTVQSGMAVWPGDPAVRIERIQSLERGAAVNLTHCSFTAHTGTHVDAPRHFLADGAAVDAIPLEAVMGPCRVVGVGDPEAVRPAGLPGDLQRGERILFKTKNSFYCNGLQPFHEDLAYVSREAAEVLAAAGVQTVGIDYLSIGGFHHDLVATHTILLRAGVWIIEGLDLSAVVPGRYELACLPLRLAGADGAPARAALRRL